ncbi:MAG: hypothetical protein JKX69_09035 [Rhodobacteraceae bacterium]|nr:hypothetical protein [Paracoccaceae bacterium]
MFEQIAPVLAVLDMRQSLAFWQRLGLKLDFADTQDPDRARYAAVSRDGLVLHLQSFAPDQMQGQGAISLRIRMSDMAALTALHAEWAALDVVTAPLAQKPWGTVEFGFYTREGAALFFYIDRPN